MPQWTDLSERLAASPAAIFTFILMLAIAHEKVNGAQDSLLPPPPIPRYVPTEQAPPTLNTAPAHNPALLAQRQIPMTSGAPAAPPKNTLQSFPIRPSSNHGPSRVVAEAAHSIAPAEQSGAAGPVLSHPTAVPVKPSPVGPVNGIRIAENVSTAVADIRHPPRASLRVPREIQLRTGKMLKAGKKLAERGAVYSARQEFLGVLQLIAQSHDAQFGRRFHTRALANGLRALREADDFVAHRTDYNVDLQMEGLVAGHQTPVLKHTPVRDLTTLVAMQRYYEYASDQLAMAGNREPAASEALYAIGRAETAMATKSAAKLGGPKPLAFYQAALVVDASNSAASNELGVLLARAGKLEQAANVLQHALSIRSTPELVNNLNAVNRRLHGGEALPPLELAPKQMTPEMLAQRVQVKWMTPQEYSRQIGPTPPIMSHNVNLPREMNPHNSLPAPRQKFPMMTR